MFLSLCLAFWNAFRDHFYCKTAEIKPPTYEKIPKYQPIIIVTSLVEILVGVWHIYIPFPIHSDCLACIHVNVIIYSKNKHILEISKEIIIFPHG